VNGLEQLARRSQVVRHTEALGHYLMYLDPQMHPPNTDRWMDQTKRTVEYISAENPNPGK